MFRYVIRRVIQAVGVLVVSTFVMYVLASVAMDPLDDLRISNSPNLEQQMANRTELLHLDRPITARYAQWASGYLGCFIGQCDLGTAWRSGQEVIPLLMGASSLTLRLVLAATVLAIVVGVAVGVISALRQYSGFDYSVLFVSFVLYSLPAFWAAVLLKQWGAIGVNNFLGDPVFSWSATIVTSVIAAIVWSAVIGGPRSRRLITAAVAFAATAAALASLTLGGWLEAPSIGPVVIGVTGLGVALCLIFLLADLRHRRLLITGGTTVALGIALYYPAWWFFGAYEMSWLLAGALGAAAVGTGATIGWLVGGESRHHAVTVGVVTALTMGALTFVDRVLAIWPAYVNSSAINGRPIATIGPATPGLGGDFWVQTLDGFTHLVLPTISLVLISFASYTRYARGSMLEVMSQDYVRTARAKGLRERTVVLRHGFRNSLIPMATIVPVDLVTLVGGAIITESIFGWSGMGSLFVTSLRNSEIDPLMAYVVLIGFLAVMGNLIADLCYGALDPRIRLEARR